MKLIPVLQIPRLPEMLHTYTRNARLFDSSCSETARVWFADKDSGYYIKRAPSGSLREEAEMIRFFHKLGLGPELLAYLPAEEDWMVTRALPGNDCLHQLYLENPKRLSETLGQFLRQLHETDAPDCPVPDRSRRYIDDTLRRYHSLPHPSAAEEGAWQVVQRNLDILDSRVLLHGDYCLPNVMLDNWTFSGFLDVGGGGIGDRHIDLYWGCWSLQFNLKDTRFCSRFLDAYGRRDVDTEKLRILNAFEAFG